MGLTELWLAHLACVELCIGVREAGELSGTAVEVDVAGPKGGQEAQMVIHWETQAGSEGLAQWVLSSVQSMHHQARAYPWPSVPCTCKGCSPIHVQRV